ncbi:MAG TPA: YCF48-related protein [Chitinophagaceae bacterium]|nr:YCF48-related protein [Chitinophagaceae bacterium]
MAKISNRIPLLVILFINLSLFSFAQNKFWAQTNGPTGGRITAIAVDSKEKIYCGTFGGNIFQSSSHEKFWEQIGLDVTHNNIISIITDLDGYIYFASVIDGIFRASSEKKKWEKINNGLTNLEITALTILPDGKLLAGTKAGLFSSFDRGDTWAKIKEFNHVINTIETCGVGIYIGSNEGLLSYSPDQCKSWQKINIPASMTISCLAISRDTIYVGTKEGDVFYSEKNKLDWSKRAHFDANAVKDLEIDSIGNIYVALAGPDFTNRGGGVYLIPANGGNPELVFKDSSNAVWCIKTSGTKVYAGTNKGIYQSNDKGISWIPVNAGLIAQRVLDIIINKNDEIFVGSYGGVFFSNDNGNSWTELNNGLTNIGIEDMAINKNGDLFAGTYTSDIFRSTDNGKTWHKTSNGLPMKNVWISGLAINSQNVVFATTGSGVYRSKDNGDSWMPVNNGLENSFYNAVIIDAGDIIYVGNEEGNVFHSDNLGDDWKKLPVSNPINDAPSDLAVDSEHQLYFGSTNKGIFRYSGVDQKWIPLNDGLTNTTIRSLIINKEGAIFAGTGIPGAMNYQKLSGDNFFTSVDKGKSWSLMNSGLSHPRIRAIAINSKGVIFAGSAGGGVYKSLSPVNFR